MSSIRRKPLQGGYYYLIINIIYKQPAQPGTPPAKAAVGYYMMPALGHEVHINYIDIALAVVIIATKCFFTPGDIITKKHEFCSGMLFENTCHSIFIIVNR